MHLLLLLLQPVHCSTFEPNKIIEFHFPKQNDKFAVALIIAKMIVRTILIK